MDLGPCALVGYHELSTAIVIAGVSTSTAKMHGANDLEIQVLEYVVQQTHVHKSQTTTVISLDRP